MKLNINTDLYKQSIRSARKGFTLIELLVVMAILAVLASISYGPIMGYLNKGKITEVRSVCNDIEVAVESFKSEYTYLPYNGTHPNDDENIVTDTPAGINFIIVLQGRETDVNDKQIEYFKGKVAKSSKNGIIETGKPNAGALVDHWANPFTIRLDYDGDGRVDTAKLDPVFKGFQNLDVISATQSKDRTWEDENITSW